MYAVIPLIRVFSFVFCFLFIKSSLRNFTTIFQTKYMVEVVVFYSLMAKIFMYFYHVFMCFPFDNFYLVIIFAGAWSCEMSNKVNLCPTLYQLCPLPHDCIVD